MRLLWWTAAGSWALSSQRECKALDSMTLTDIPLNATAHVYTSHPLPVSHGVSVVAATCRKDGLVLSMMGTEATFEVLNVMEYSSARGRMSVIVRAPNGSIRLLCKGADSKVLAILDKAIPHSLQNSTQANLHLFATQVLGPLRLPSTSCILWCPVPTIFMRPSFALIACSNVTS